MVYVHTIIYDFCFFSYKYFVLSYNLYGIHTHPYLRLLYLKLKSILLLVIIYFDVSYNIILIMIHKLYLIQYLVISYIF